MNNRIVSLASRVATRNISGKADILDVLADVKNGTYRGSIAELRRLYAACGSGTGDVKSEYDEYKSNRLPAFTPAGEFRSRQLNGYVAGSGLFVIDYDHVPDVAALREKLRDDPYTLAAFASPTDGVKAIVRVDIHPSDPRKADADIKAIFPRLQGHYGRLHHVDDSGKDLPRLCLVSDDPELWTYPMAKAFDVPVVVASAGVPTPSPAPAIQQPTQHHKPADQQSPSDTSALEAVASHVRNILSLGVRLKDTEGKARHGFMLSAGTTIRRYVLAGCLTESEGRNILVDEYGQLFPNSESRARDAARAYDSERCKEIAAREGALTVEASPLPDKASDVTHERMAALWDMVYAPAWDNKLPDVPAVLTFGDDNVEVGHIGSITAIIASYSAGKSTLAAALWAAYYAGDDPDIDTLGFRVRRPDDKPIALYLDSEQAHRESWQTWSRALRRTGIAKNGELPHGADASFLCTVDIVSNIERQALLFYLLETHTNVGMVILDGVADFVKDVNDAHEVDGFMARLRSISSKAGILPVLTIHKNKGRDDPRGHLGSDILRRGSIAIVLSRDNGLHKITVDKARGGKAGVSWSFTYDEERQMHVSVGKPAEPIGKDIRSIELLRTSLKPSGVYTKSDILELLKVADPEHLGKASLRTLERVLSMAVDVRTLVKPRRNCYQLAPEHGGDEPPLTLD
jgi:hypothetical protein